jgi:hypothetical protein
MSHPKQHEDATAGEFCLHDNGCVYFRTVHHMSWIDDNGVRIFSPMLERLCAPEEIETCKQLAASHDAGSGK